MDLAFAEITTLAPLVARRDVSPVELTRACLDQIHAYDRAINAFITVLEDSALAEAEVAEREIAAGHYRGPLHGIPIAHKDLYETRGVRTTAGSKILAEFVPERDATVVERWRTAGTVLLGKLNMHEFAAGGTNENPHYGAAHNPWDLSRIPGGSSGGSSAALAMGLCHGATGSDTAGSIRIPSSYCGTSGIKPTYGRVSAYGVIPLSWSLDHCGPMARSARDCALLLQAMAGFDARDSASVDRPVPDFSAELDSGVRGLRIGVASSYFNETLEPEVDSAWRSALDVLFAHGAQPVDVAFDAVQQSDSIGPIILRTEMATYHAEWFASRPDDYGDGVRDRLASAQALPAQDYIRAQRARDVIRAEFRSVFERVDVLVVPTLSATAPAIGSDMASLHTRFTYPFNLTGLPVLAIPCGFDSRGLPIGLQIVAPAWQEALALRVGHAYQRDTAWHQRRPPVPAVPAYPLSVTSQP